MSSVTILVPDVAQNGLGRADTLARVLRADFDVEIVGPQFGPGIWAPLRDGAAAVPVHGVAMPGKGFRAALPAYRDLRRRLTGDLLYVCKPFATTIWAARKEARARRAPVAIDIDDFEWGVQKDLRTGFSVPRRVHASLDDLDSLHHRRDWNAFLGDRWARGRRYAARTVSNRFLQRRFGGTLVPHVRDTDEFDPTRFDGKAERRRLGLEGDDTLVMFLGTPRPHKGLETLAEAVQRTPGCTLAIVGADERPSSQPFQEQLRRLASDRVRFLPAQPFGAAARTLSAADILAIPQERTPASEGQIPAKLFDAMAMAKPIVATAVSDIPEWLDGCGLVTPAGDAAAMGKALSTLAGDPALRERLGRAARERCIAKASVRSARAELVPLLEASLGA